MYELRVSVSKVLGRCTADPPMKPGDFFTLRDGSIRIPDGSYICLWALQSVIPLLTPKEREIAEAQDKDWMWRVHHAQCPDPKGRVILKIERVGRVKKSTEGMERNVSTQTMRRGTEEAERRGGGAGGLQDLRVVVEEVRGKCTSGLRPGDYLTLRSGRLYIPPGRHFCLYALQAVLPLLPAKQRPLADGDWLKEDSHIICPDPAGNVILRVEPVLR